jgi:hypothetical protein
MRNNIWADMILQRSGFRLACGMFYRRHSTHRYNAIQTTDSDIFRANFEGDTAYL